MGQFDPKYSDDQRRAIEYAYLDAAIRPATEIPRLAAAGELVLRGERVPAFEIPYGTALGIAKDEERRRTGRAHSQLVNQPHPDAMETLRRRMVSLLDHETQRLERVQKRHENEPADAEQLRKVGRAMRELASMPDPAKRALRPGADTRTGKATGESTAQEGSLAHSVIASLQPGAGLADRSDSTPTPQQATTENSGGDDGDERAERANGAGTPNGDDDRRINVGVDEAPGSYAQDGLRSLVALDVRPAQEG